MTSLAKPLYLVFDDVSETSQQIADLGRCNHEANHSPWKVAAVTLVKSLGAGRVSFGDVASIWNRNA